MLQFVGLLFGQLLILRVGGEDVIVPRGATYVLACDMQGSNYCRWELNGRKCEYVEGQGQTKPRACEEIPGVRWIEGDDCPLELPNFNEAFAGVWSGQAANTEGGGSQPLQCQENLQVFTAATVSMASLPQSMSLGTEYLVQCTSSGGIPEPKISAQVKSTIQLRNLDEDSSRSSGQTHVYKFTPSLEDGGNIDIYCVSQQYVLDQLRASDDKVLKAVVNFPPQNTKLIQVPAEVNQGLNFSFVIRAFPPPNIREIEWHFEPIEAKPWKVIGQDGNSNYRIGLETVGEGFYDISLSIRLVDEELQYIKQFVRVRNTIGSRDYPVILNGEEITDPVDNTAYIILGSVLAVVFALVIVGGFVYDARKKGKCCFPPPKPETGPEEGFPLQNTGSAQGR